MKGTAAVLTVWLVLGAVYGGWLGIGALWAGYETGGLRGLFAATGWLLSPALAVVVFGFAVETEVHGQEGPAVRLVEKTARAVDRCWRRLRG